MKIAFATFLALLATVAAACVESPEGAGQAPPPQVVTQPVTVTVPGPTQVITQPVTVTATPAPAVKAPAPRATPVPAPAKGYASPAPAPSAQPVQPAPAAQPAPAQLPPFGQPPQPQIGHPSLYVETGVGQTRVWNQAVEADKVAIVGGFRVDGVSGGVYKALPGNQTVNVAVTDGFIAIVRADWANAEFCFRLGQAKQFGWAHNTIQPLPGWAPC